MDAYRSVQTFDLYALRYRLVARQPFGFPKSQTANTVRGRLGMALHRDYPELYARLFAPQAAEGPSGLRDSPRPFTLRIRHLEGHVVAPGQLFDVGLNLFETRNPPVDHLGKALAEGLLAECVGIEGRELLRLSLAPYPAPVKRLRVRFLTPTELKPAGPPEFGILIARIRDRISALRQLYGEGPLEISFREIGEHAAAVRMTLCELEAVEGERVSRSTGQRHSLGGFIGVVEYEGDLAEFIPYLEIARWTGVGRQTVWGKGEIAFETF